MQQRLNNHRGYNFKAKQEDKVTKLITKNRWKYMWGVVIIMYGYWYNGFVNSYINEIIFLLFFNFLKLNFMLCMQKN